MLLFVLSADSLEMPHFGDCHGGVPKNDLRIPVNNASLSQQGLDETTFNRTLDKIQDYFGKNGRRIVVERRWSNEQVNAFAMIDKTGAKKIWVMGGLARHPAMTEDALLVISCHEVGHHYGAAPRRTGLTRDNWASVEGQSDYYASFKCLKEIFADEDNASALQDRRIDPFADAQCSAAYSDPKGALLCLRSVTAGQELAVFFAALESAEPPRLETPDPTRVLETLESHSRAQCRLDTLFQGALCPIGWEERLSSSHPLINVCHSKSGHSNGARPQCWFKE